MNLSLDSKGKPLEAPCKYSNLKVTEIIFLSHSEKARLTGTTHSLTKSANRCHNATCT